MTASGAWAIVPTGHLGDLVNTFWQLLFRPPGATRWAIVTPPGVADNGGLVAAPSAGGLTVGFEPSQNLKVSPLAITANGGASWTQGLVPAGLEALPDALIIAVSSDPLALVRTAGGTVLQGDSSLTTWSPVVGRAALARSAAGRSCGIGILSALATTGGSAVIGTACSRPGVVGIFAHRDGTWTRSAPALGPAGEQMATTVLRLTGGAAGLSGLIEVGQGRRSRILAAWAGPPGERWTVSGPLRTGGSSIASTGSGDGDVVLTRSRQGRLAVSVITGPGAQWMGLPAPPPATQAVVVDGTTIDALSVRGSTLTDWTLSASGAAWQSGQVIDVPVQYGSSG